MAVDVALAPADALARARIRAVPARWVLAGLVAASAIMRSLVALGHVTPVYFPDEYLYVGLARSLAESGRPLLHGAPAHFPALLEPLLAAPFWLAAEPATALRLTQTLHALAMSLAAIPVYLLVRRLGFGSRFALAAAAITLASPDLYYASLTMAEPVAYPLVLSAVYAGVRALARPTARAQLLFLALSGLASFARLQFAVLPLAFMGAALVVERGRVLRTYRTTLAALAAPLVLLLALGPARLLGPYVGVFVEGVEPLDLLGWAGTNGMLLAYAAGWVLVPGALVGLACAVGMPRSRAEAAFGALTVPLGFALVAEAALVADLDSERFHERYLFVLLPLAVPAFGLALRRGRRAALATVGLALALLVLAVRMPVSEYLVAHGRDDSPTLLALARLERLLGIGDSALAIALLAGMLSLAAAAVALRPRRGAPAALALTLAVGAALSGGAAAYDAENARNARSLALPADPSWIDHAGLGDVTLLQPPGGERAPAFEQLTWNRSVGEVLLMPGVPRLDAFAHTRVRVADDGRIVAGARTIRAPLLVQTTASTVELTGAVMVAQGPAFDLWRPAGTTRVTLLADGRYADGWLRWQGAITVWPDASGRTRGTLRLDLSLPRGHRTTELRLGTRRLTLRPGERRAVAIAVDRSGPWRLRYSTSSPNALPDLPLVGVRADELGFTRSL